jgi:hypothetical protein
MDGRIVADLQSVSICNFIEPGPDSSWTPRTECSGQHTAPAHPLGCKASCLSPKAQPSPAAKQFRQQLHAIVAQPHIAAATLQHDLNFSFVYGVVHAVRPSGAADTDQRPFEEKEVAVEIFER